MAQVGRGVIVSSTQPEEVVGFGNQQKQAAIQQQDDEEDAYTWEGVDIILGPGGNSERSIGTGFDTISSVDDSDTGAEFFRRQQRASISRSQANRDPSPAAAPVETGPPPEPPTPRRGPRELACCIPDVIENERQNEVPGLEYNRGAFAAGDLDDNEWFPSGDQSATDDPLAHSEECGEIPGLRERRSGDVDTPPTSLHEERMPLLPRFGEHGGAMPPPTVPSVEVHRHGIGMAGLTGPPGGFHSLKPSPVPGSVGTSSSASPNLSSPANGSFPQQPVLYSAIGSLEQVSSNSYGSLNKKFMYGHGRNNFAQQQGATLIAPGLIPPLVLPERSLFVHKETSATGDSQSGLSSDAANRLESEPEESGAEGKHNVPSLLSGLPSKPAAKQRRRISDSDAKAGSGGSKNKKTQGDRRKSKRVTIDLGSIEKAKQSRPVEMFRPSCDAYTPRMGKKNIKYKPAEMRTPVQRMATEMGTLSRPNFRDALRRVAMIIHQHVVKIERRFEGARPDEDEKGIFRASMRDAFSEENFATPRYKCTMVRIPMARPGMVHALRRIRVKYNVPSEEEIYDFAHQLFKSVQLSSECSIVCLIYVERLMEVARVPLLASTWRPIFMCGLLLASKVWQDLSSWNIEFASVYPQYSLEAINRLELEFLRMVKWDLYISSSLYAKYYFALRSLVEKRDFRQRYNRMVGGVDSVDASQALKIQQRTERVKEKALLLLSRSM